MVEIAVKVERGYECLILQTAPLCESRHHLSSLQNQFVAWYQWIFFHRVEVNTTGTRRRVITKLPKGKTAHANTPVRTSYQAK